MTMPDSATCDARGCSDVAAWTIATCCEEACRCQQCFDAILVDLVVRHDAIQCRRCGVTYTPTTRILRRMEAR